jgi:hypothetical protein
MISVRLVDEWLCCAVARLISSKVNRLRCALWET